MARRKALRESKRRNIQHLRDVSCEMVDGSVDLRANSCQKSLDMLDMCVPGSSMTKTNTKLQ